MIQLHKPRAIVLLSGGMDSCVCAAVAARDYDAAALHVSYGQRTEQRERDSFERICDRLGIDNRMVVRNEAFRQIEIACSIENQHGKTVSRGTLHAGVIDVARAHLEAVAMEDAAKEGWAK